MTTEEYEIDCPVGPCAQHSCADVSWAQLFQAVAALVRCFNAEGLKAQVLRQTDRSPNHPNPSQG